jgi:hypothetical protein
MPELPEDEPDEFVAAAAAMNIDISNPFKDAQVPEGGEGEQKEKKEKKKRKKEEE